MQDTRPRYKNNVPQEIIPRWYTFHENTRLTRIYNISPGEYHDYVQDTRLTLRSTTIHHNSPARFPNNNFSPEDVQDYTNILKVLRNLSSFNKRFLFTKKLRSILRNFTNNPANCTRISLISPQIQENVLNVLQLSTNNPYFQQNMLVLHVFHWDLLV